MLDDASFRADLESLKVDFGRLFNSEAWCQAQTIRKYYPSRFTTKPTFSQYPPNTGRNLVIGAAGWHVHPKFAETVDDFNVAEMFFNSDGSPVVNSCGQPMCIAQGWRDQNSLYVEGGGSRQVFETLDLANHVVKCHLHSIARLLNVERAITFGDCSWPSIVNYIAGLVGSASLPQIPWYVRVGEEEWTVEAWKHRAEFNTPQSLASFSEEIEAAIGDQPEVVYCKRDKFIRASELAIEFLLAQSERLKATSDALHSQAVMAAEMKQHNKLLSEIAAEYRIHNYKLRNYVLAAAESVTDMLAEIDRPKFLQKLARFEVAVMGANKSFNELPGDVRIQLDGLRIGIPPRKLWAFLNNVLQCVQAIKFSDLQLSVARAELEENGLPFRPNDWFSIIEEIESMTDLLHDKTSVRGAEKSDGLVDTLIPKLEPAAVKQSAVSAVAAGLVNDLVGQWVNNSEELQRLREAWVTHKLNGGTKKTFGIDRYNRMNYLKRTLGKVS